jgi:outer membrane protein assembly factor BamB
MRLRFKFRIIGLWAALAVAGPLAAQSPATDWPAWLGPNGNFSAARSPHDLVDDLNLARQVWTSDAEIPGARCADSRRVVKRDEGQISGGFASPIMAGGRVYLYYYVPNGEAQDERILARHEPAGGFGREKWAIDTDDVIHCFDAATGKTLWKRVFAGKGMNFNLFNKGGPCNLTPVVADARLYAVGSAGKVYCLDAATGRPIWESDVGERHRRQETLREVCKQQKRIPQYNRDFSSAPVVADGVVVVSDFLGYKVQSPVVEFNWGHGCGLVGLDAATGKRLWHLPRTLGNWASPVKWTFAGKDYIIAGGGGGDDNEADEDGNQPASAPAPVPPAPGKLICVEPRTGRLLWEIPAAKLNKTVIVGENHVIFPVGAPPALTCYRITPQQAEKRWSLPAAYGGQCPGTIADGHAWLRCANGRLVCVELDSGNIVAEQPFSKGDGFFLWVNGRLLIDADTSHDRNAVTMYRADPAGFAPLGRTWPAPSATSYMNPMTPALADGRLYMRSTHRIICYDLRKSP